MSNFDLLHPAIQQWIWAQGWAALRPAQEQAIDVLLPGEHDVLISAATAAGKTEAAFFPLLTRLAQAEDEGLPPKIILYVAPIKALINDQAERIAALGAGLELNVVPWHGDAPASAKKRFLKRPAGVLLITPESLEGLFVRRGGSLAQIFEHLDYVVIDEAHEFISSVRGKQLQSLLSRLEIALGRRVPIAALSATLGDMAIAADFVRPRAGSSVKQIITSGAGREVRLAIKGYYATPPENGDGQEEELSSRADDKVTTAIVGGGTVKSSSSPIEEDEEDVIGDEDPLSSSPGDLQEMALNPLFMICQDMYRVMKGTNNLIFPNSRPKVEWITNVMNQLCAMDGRSHEFWAHHGSLSKELRADAEAALKNGEKPATAIATSTLEMGVDIGYVNCIGQVGPAYRVSSLAQRLGRSGRRAGTYATLRTYCIEQRITRCKWPPQFMRSSLVQAIAMVRLYIGKWCEPPEVGAVSYSTMVQQIMSLVVQTSGILIPDVWTTLVIDGAFSQVSKEDFVLLLRAMVHADLIMQDAGSGELLLGSQGEQLVASYEFLAVFASQAEFRVLHHGHEIGTIPLLNPVTPGMKLIVGGRGWVVVSISQHDRVIVVKEGKGGAAALFDANAGRVHGRIRSEMRDVLSSADPIPYLDPVAQEQLAEARSYYRKHQLDLIRLLPLGAFTYLFTWSSDAVNDTIALALESYGAKAVNDRFGVVVATDEASIRMLLARFSEDEITPESLLANVENIQLEKWDFVVPKPLLIKRYAAAYLNLDDAKKVARDIISTCE